MKRETKQLINSLNTALEALQGIPADENTQAAIEAVQDAIGNTMATAKQETADEILSNLARQNRTNFEMLVISSDDFAGELAKALVEKGLDPDDLSEDELTELHDLAAEYLNGEGMPWAEVVGLALADAWPERLGNFYENGA